MNYEDHWDAARGARSRQRKQQRGDECVAERFRAVTDTRWSADGAVIGFRVQRTKGSNQRGVQAGEAPCVQERNRF